VWEYAPDAVGYEGKPWTTPGIMRGKVQKRRWVRGEIPRRTDFGLLTASDHRKIADVLDPPKGICDHCQENIYHDDN
jgi:hypothetical protein